MNGLFPGRTRLPPASAGNRYPRPDCRDQRFRPGPVIGDHIEHGSWQAAPAKQHPPHASGGPQARAAHRPAAGFPYWMPPIPEHRGGRRSAVRSHRFPMSSRCRASVAAIGAGEDKSARNRSRLVIQPALLRCPSARRLPGADGPARPSIMRQRGNRQGCLEAAGRSWRDSHTDLPHPLTRVAPSQESAAPFPVLPDNPWRGCAHPVEPSFQGHRPWS